MSFPNVHWRQIRSTNPLKPLNKEIRRRTDVVGIFPRDNSALCLVTMLLRDQSDAWCVGRRYFSQESMKLLAVSAPNADALLEVAAVWVVPAPPRDGGPFRPPSRRPLDQNFSALLDLPRRENPRTR